MTKQYENLKQLAQDQGTELGVSDWIKIDQARINAFADATDDHQWIHVDPERAKKELNMTTIAHGFLTLSLIPKFMFEIFSVKSADRIFNYGCNKVRFTNMVPVDSRLRGRVFLTRAVLSEGSMRAIAQITIEIEGVEKPALIAETITLFYE